MKNKINKIVDVKVSVWKKINKKRKEVSKKFWNNKSRGLKSFKFLEIRET